MCACMTGCRWRNAMSHVPALRYAHEAGYADVRTPLCAPSLSSVAASSSKGRALSVVGHEYVTLPPL